MALTARQVADLYDRLSSAGATRLSLEDWSRQMNDLTGTDLYSEGENINFIKRASIGIDRALESVPGLVEGATELGRSAGSLIGAPEAGARVGATLPRTTLNMLPYLIPGVGWGAAAARLGGAGLLAGIDAYTQTGSPASGITSGVIAAALPKGVDMIEQAVLGRMGANLVSGPVTRELAMEGNNITKLAVDQIKRYYPETFGQRVAAEGAGQVGAAGILETQRWGEELFSGQPLHSPFTAENFLNLTLGNLPFAAMHLGGRALGLPGPAEQARQARESIAKTESLIELKSAQDRLAEMSDLEKIPRVDPNVSPEVQAEISARLSALRGEQEKITSKASISPEDTERLNQLVEEDVRQPFTPTTTSVLGAEQPAEHLLLVGKQLHETSKWRKILVADDEANPPEFRGQVIEYSKGLREPAPTKVGDTEFMSFGVTADPLWRTTKSWAEEQERQAKYAAARQPAVSSATPELPVQERPAAELFDHISQLDLIESDVDAARTPAQIQKAILRLRSLEENIGLTAFDDKQLMRVMSKLAAKGEKTDLEKKAIKVRTARAKRLLQAEAERQQATATAEGWFAEQTALGENSPVQALLNDYNKFATDLSKRGARGSALVDSGQLMQMLHNLRDEPTAMERLRTQVEEILRTGKGLRKVRPVSDEVHEVVVSNEDSGPVRNIVAESALRSLQNAQARQAFESWERKGETNWDYEKRTFVDWTDEFGPPHTDDINDAAEFFADRDGVPVAEVKDELRDFLTRPHVRIWSETLESNLKNAKAHAPTPNKIFDPTNLRQGVTGYEATPNSLLGFKAEGPNKTFDEQRFPIALNVEISLDGGQTWAADSIKGLNQAHAIERARRNWDEGVLIRLPQSEVRAPQLQVPKSYVSDIAAEQEVISRITGDGLVLTKELLTSSDPYVSAIAADLVNNFPEALTRIDSGVYETPGSYAARRPAGRVGIFLDRAVPSASKFVRDNIILHELIHGLTLHEITSPKVRPEIVAELTQLRESLIKALPAEMKTKLQEAIDSDWYSRYVAGTTDMYELYPKADKAQILYGLLNNDELASQGFSSHSMRGYMQSVGGKKVGAWNRFTNWVRSLLGMKEVVHGTAFADFLDVTSQLMRQGEWLADFANYGERYMEGKGRGASYGRAQTQRALGLVADSAHALDEPLTVATTLDFGASRNQANPALRKAKRELDAAIQTDPELALDVSNVLSELGHHSVDEMVTSAIGEKQSITEALDLLPPEATNYVYEKLRDSKDVLDIVASATTAKNSLITNIANPKLARDAVMPVLKEIDKLLAHEEFQTRMATELGELSAVAPEGFLDALPSMAPKAFEDFVNGASDAGGKTLSWFSKYLEPVGQWARRVPEVAEAVSKGFQLSANSRKMFHEGVKWLGMDTSSEYVDVLTHDSVKETETVLGNPKLLDKVDRWMYLNNKKGGAEVQMLPDNDPDVAKLMSGLSDAERTQVRDVVAKAGKVTQMMNAEKLEKMTQLAAVNGAAVAGLSSGLKTRDNIALSDATLRAVLDMSDPMKAPFAQAQLASVQQRMQPEAFLELLKFFQGEADKIKLWKQYFDANPFWATAQRTERFLVEYTKNGKKFKGQASSIKEADDLIAKKGGKKVSIEDQWRGREDEPFAFPNMSPEMAQRMQEIETNQYAMLSKVLSPEDLEAVRRTSAVTQIMREATADRSIPEVQAPARLLSQGAEELPWMWNHISWAQKEANYWSRALLRAQARTYLSDPEIRNNPELRNRLKTHFDNMLMPDPIIAQKTTRFMATWFLGYNMATAMINLAQPIMTHAAELTSMTGKPLDSYRRILGALREVGGREVGRKDWATKEHEQLIADASKDGEIALDKYDDEAAAQESIATNYKRAMKKNKPQTLGQRLGTLAGAYSTAGMWVFKQGERVNNQAALLASFDYYREQGMNYKEAKEKAYEFNHAVNYGGGRAQRPVGLYASRSPFLRGAAMLGTSLQSYVLGTTAQIARYLQRGGFRPSGLAPQEIYAARKAAIQMLGTQFVAAGLLGMPFVSGALALLDKEFPELELNRRTREGVNSLWSEDEENGSVLTDMALTGVPSMFGWDMQSRLSMGNTLPGVSEVNGFQPENLMGPSANLVRNFVNGTTGWLRGDAKAGMNYLPPAVKKVVETANSYLQAKPGIRDYAGRPLAAPSRGEALGSFLGFQPKRLSDQNAAARILKQTEEVARTQEGRFRSRQAEAVLKGNFGTVRQELKQRMQQSKDYDAVGAVQAIARAAEELAFPRDLRREGTTRGSGARSALLATYNGGSGVASEMDRLKFRIMVEQRLGLQGNYNREMKISALVDQLRLQNPNATRLELRAAASEAFRRASPRTLGSPLEVQ